MRPSKSSTPNLLLKKHELESSAQTVPSAKATRFTLTFAPCKGRQGTIQTMPPSSLTLRFIEGIWRGLFSTVEDKLAEILITLAGAVYLLHRSHLSWHSLLRNYQEAMTVGVWVICALVSWHGFRSAYAVSAAIRKEASTGPERPTILSPYGNPIKSQSADRSYSYATAKLYGMAVCLLVVASCASYLAWKMTPTEATQSPVSPPSSTSPAPKPNSEGLPPRINKYANITNERLIDLAKTAEAELANAARFWQVKDHDITLEEYDRVEGGYYTEKEARAKAQQQRNQLNLQNKRQYKQIVDDGIGLYVEILARIPAFDKQDLISDKSIGILTKKLRTDAYGWDELRQMSSSVGKARERLEGAISPLPPL